MCSYPLLPESQETQLSCGVLCTKTSGCQSFHFLSQGGAIAAGRCVLVGPSGQHQPLTVADGEKWIFYVRTTEPKIISQTFEKLQKYCKIYTSVTLLCCSYYMFRSIYQICYLVSAFHSTDHYFMIYSPLAICSHRTNYK